MIKYLKYTFVALVALATGCSNVEGEPDADAYDADAALDSVTGISAGAGTIEFTLYNSVYQLYLAFGSNESTLPAEDYAYTPGTPAKGEFTANLTAHGRELALGADTKIEVGCTAEVYNIVLTSTLKSGERIRLSYEGEIEFLPKVSATTGTLLRDQTLPSSVMGSVQLYTVYLPQGWSKDKTYPVLYMLHGATNFGATGHNDWTQDFRFDELLTEAIAKGEAPEMVVIFPNCCVDGENLFYCNNYQGGKYAYMTYFFTELLPQLEKKYSVRGDRAGRMVAGLSMGGYGSLYFGALHPEMFSYVYACSPATWLDGAPNIFDLYTNDKNTNAPLPGITIEIGTSDFLFSSAAWLEGHLKSLGIEHEYITRDGTHDWKFWSECAPKIVAKAAEQFRK